jgi:hypothetical protein
MVKDLTVEQKIRVQELIEKKEKEKKVSHKGELDAVKDLKKTAESGTNSYSSYNKKMINALKKD